MHDDPGTISFNPYHQNPKYRTDDEISYSNDHSGPESPRLWKNSPSPSRPLLNLQNSRKEAIVRGQWELMEMVRSMPESSYELSLKDMVEHRAAVENPGPESGPVGSDQSLHQRAVGKVKRDKIERNLSLENNKGVFLNLVFPCSIKFKRKGTNSEGVKGEKDWWKKKFRGSSDSDSSGMSNNSGSSGGATTSSGGSSGGSSDSGVRKKNSRWLSACWPFLHSRRNKSAK